MDLGSSDAGRTLPHHRAVATHHGLMSGSILGAYTILDRLGAGGMGEVYRARHNHLEKLVAIKVLINVGRQNSDAQHRFEREMRSIGRLDHPNIVRATDAGFDRGVPFLVMELLDGIDGHSLVQHHGPLPIADALEITRQLAIALAHAHRHGLVHRDVKPSNTMVLRDASVKLLDLGLAAFDDGVASDRLTLTHQVMGTPDYLSPEQAADARQASFSSDIYSLGCTLYYFLAGRPPFGDPQHDTLTKKLLAHTLEQPPPIAQFRPETPSEVVLLLEEMLNKTPAERPSSAEEVRKRIDEIAVTNGLTQILTRSSAVPSTLKSDEALVSTQTFYVDKTKAWNPESSTPDQLAGARQKAARATQRGWPLLPILGFAVLGVAVLLIILSLAPSMFRTLTVDADLKPSGRVEGPKTDWLKELAVTQFRSEGSQLRKFQHLGEQPLLVGDDLRLSVTFSQPRYAYLVALNTDGSVQLCLPEDNTEPPSLQTRMELYPDASAFFTLTEGAGTQAFLVIASTQPLPTWQEWSTKQSELVWGRVPSKGMWLYQDGAFRAFEGQFDVIRDRGSKSRNSPILLAELCQKIQASNPGLSLCAVSLAVEAVK